MPTAPTAPAADDGRPQDHQPTVTDRIRAKLRQMPAVDNQGRPIQKETTSDD